MSAIDLIVTVAAAVAALGWCLPRRVTGPVAFRAGQPAPLAGVARRHGPADSAAARRRQFGVRGLAWVSASTTRAVGTAIVLTAAIGGLVGGPVGAVVSGTYAGLTVRGVLRARASRRTRTERDRRLDRLSTVAAELRAGARTPVELPTDAVSASRLDELAAAAVRLAERTGAPLAELLERIESDARAMDRALAAAAAQAAGARATGLLLAALPVGGLLLGYGIGVDPVHLLLHTTLGAVCAIGAVGLQLVGLLWTDRLGALPVRVV
ncbi:hypothetical protein [Plantactinospora sp. GCM10030261]|uniref:hypothetical protein n=1 Tax=Plantactinospora sp. GCM10030261 TaxID=3273420 RepID=UPI003619DD3C